MAAVSLLPLAHPKAQTPLFPAWQMPAVQRGALDNLRMAAMECRTAAHTDLFEACALLCLEGEDAKRTFVSTLVTCLSDAVNKKFTWFSPGVVEQSFDEAWIMRCLTSIGAGDDASLGFLLRSRVVAHDRRYIGFLLGRISGKFCHS